MGRDFCDESERLMGDVIPLGLGAHLADPHSLWPRTTVIEVAPELSVRLGNDAESRAAVVRAALAALADVPEERIDEVNVVETAAGTLLVSMPSDGAAMRALHVAAGRRVSNTAEALHAVLADRG